MQSPKTYILLTYTFLTLLILTITSLSADDFDIEEDIADFFENILSYNDLPYEEEMEEPFPETKFSDSIQYIVRRYKEISENENELEIWLESHSDEKFEERIKMQWKSSNQKYKRFASRAQTLITKARQGRLSRSEVKDEILAINLEKDKFSIALEELANNTTKLDNIEELEEQKERLTYQIVSLSSNKQELMQHVLNVYHLTGIQLNDPETIGFNGEFIEYDIQILEDILFNSLTIEELQTELEELEPDDITERIDMMETISYLKYEIIERIEIDQEILKNHLPSVTEILVRSLKKVFKIDQMNQKLAKQIEESNKEIKKHLKVVQEYQEKIDEAASVWFSMNTEL